MSGVRSHLLHLHCARCSSVADADALQTFCPCGGTWLAVYDLEGARSTLTPEALRDRPPGLWRWAEILPIRSAEHRRGLGEGGTPLVCADRLGAELGLSRLWLKDEGQNPGGSFKARGMAVAMARACELGATEFALPSAGNAGGAAAAYGAFWNVSVHVALPGDTPDTFREEVKRHGARSYDVDGDIAEAGAWLTKRPEAENWFFLSTLKEPYRAEGKKTMGLELVEQLGGRWPDVVVYPTGGGTGIVGMAKAHEEMTQLGLVEGPPPRFVVVQAETCAPLVRAFHEGVDHAPRWENPTTYANGLRVPGTIGDHLILDALRTSGGTAIGVSDAAMESARLELGNREGLYVAPEAGATLAATRELRESGWIKPEDEVVLFVTGNGFKYPLHSGTP